MCRFTGFHELIRHPAPCHWASPAGPSTESGAAEASVEIFREEQLEWGMQLPILQMRTFGVQNLHRPLGRSGAKPGSGLESVGLSSCAFLSTWLSLQAPAAFLSLPGPGAPGDRSVSPALGPPSQLGLVSRQLQDFLSGCVPLNPSSLVPMESEAQLSKSLVFSLTSSPTWRCPTA